MLRVLSVRAGIKRLDLFGQQLSLAFSEPISSGRWVLSR
jgi:hypothetical protein